MTSFPVTTSYSYIKKNHCPCSVLKSNINFDNNNSYFKPSAPQNFQNYTASNIAVAL